MWWEKLGMEISRFVHNAKTRSLLRWELIKVGGEWKSNTITKVSNRYANQIQNVWMLIFYHMFAYDIS